jgi:hypothetical protein
MAHQQMPRGLNDSVALSRADALDRGANVVAAARAYLDDNEVAFVATNEIELAEPAPIAAGNNADALPFEVLRGSVLPQTAALDAHSPSAE